MPQNLSLFVCSCVSKRSHLHHLMRLENECGQSCHRKQDIKDFVERYQGAETDE
jgi:hypothetical protein